MKSWLATIFTLVLVLAGQSAFAFWGNQKFRLSDAKSVSVQLADDAIDGCWTNLRETREYAEEKLRAKGAKIVPQPGFTNNDYELRISVVAYRTNAGCVAVLDLTLQTVTLLENLKGEGLAHIAIVAGDNLLLSGYNKANNKVLNALKEFIDNLN